MGAARLHRKPAMQVEGWSRHRVWESCLVVPVCGTRVHTQTGKERWVFGNAKGSYNWNSSRTHHGNTITQPFPSLEGSLHIPSSGLGAFAGAPLYDLHLHFSCSQAGMFITLWAVPRTPTPPVWPPQSPLSR